MFSLNTPLTESLSILSLTTFVIDIVSAKLIYFCFGGLGLAISSLNTYHALKTPRGKEGETCKSVI